MKQEKIERDAFFWVLQGLCALHRKPYGESIAQQQFAAPHTVDTLQRAIASYGFEAELCKRKARQIAGEVFPLIVWMRPASPAITDACCVEPALPAPPGATLLLVLQADAGKLLVVAPGDSDPHTLTQEQFASGFLGHVTRVTPRVDPAQDPDGQLQARQARKFGFRWFVPELLKYKRYWQEILLASLVIQLIALATPLFTQVVIDKVVQHHTRSTLLVIAVGMAVFLVFSAGLNWVRQYLVLHTGNRVDAELGRAVIEHLFKLPPLYFQHRPTGVIVSRLQGVEAIREFIAGAAVTLILDLPFLLIFVAVMFYYSVTLTLIVLAILGLVVGLSLLVAPMFQERLQRQFLLGARNQAFLTEYVAGLETTKSLQLEPQIYSKYGGYLASHLAAGFNTRQLANTYNTGANSLEQIMSLLILAIGAYTVMQNPAFTIGMLVAFQMFASRMSQPMLRLVGLWQQFQQAKLSVERLGDLMNAAIEPYSAIPARDTHRRGAVQIDKIAFRYAPDAPLVYEDLSITIPPGKTVAIMGASGCGKSTLAKLLQGFYQPCAGRITIDGNDIRFLSANELRGYFGVVPQETVLFSGTVYDNLLMACPDASFKQIVAACKMAEIHATIEALPQGYQTEIGERGAGLSGGQKQRIAIARALLKRPSILIFDEATSALDATTTEHFARTINSLRGKVSMVFIAHQLPKELHVDIVYHLDRHHTPIRPPTPTSPTSPHGAPAAQTETGTVAS